MKIRTGFVSNSSSSSFLLVFNKKPTCAMDVLAHIWPNLGEVVNEYDSAERFPASQAAEAVWDQIKEKKPMTKKEIVDEYANSWETYDACRASENDKTTEATMRKTAEKLAKGFLADSKGKFVYSVEFSDNDGEFNRTMEHGNAFDNIPHKRISHH